MGVKDLKRVIGRVSKSISLDRAGVLRLPRPSLEDAFGVVHLPKGTHVFHSPSYFHDPMGKRPPKYGPTETHSPFFYTEDTVNSWMYRLEQDLKLLKLYEDGPPTPISGFSRTCLKGRAYSVIFDREPEIPLVQWRGDTSTERDSLVEAIFALGHDGFISTGDNSHDERLEVCIHKTHVFSHIPRASDAEVAPMVIVPTVNFVKDHVRKVPSLKKDIDDQITEHIAIGIMMILEDELYLSDGTWDMPDEETQEEAVDLFLSESTLPKDILPTHKELSKSVQNYFQDLSKLDPASQQKQIQEGILRVRGS